MLNQTTTQGKANTEMDTYSLLQYVEFIVAKPESPPDSGLGNKEVCSYLRHCIPRREVGPFAPHIQGLGWAPFILLFY